MLYFHNPGEIDIRGATVAGLSAKDTDSPIGFFGTGLKYSVACILRWGGTITIFSGLTRYDFATSAVDFRGKSFAQITMNGEPIGFTTEYGKTWEDWNIFRELYANALDEGGGVRSQETTPSAGHTLIVVSCPEVEACYSTRDKIILPSDMAYDDVQSGVCIANRSAESIFYRGVRVYDRASVLTWNFLNDFDLTENRTLARTWVVGYRIGKALQASSNTEIIIAGLQAPKGTAEKDAEFDSYAPTTPEFIDIAKRLFKENPERYSRLEPIILKHAPELLNPKPIVLSHIRQRMLDKAVTLVARMGVDPATCPIHVAELGGSILGKYSKKTGEVFLSPEVFNQGTKQVLSTLYEELIHAKTGKEDCNYDMQTFLFNTIISLYEEHVFQEPI